jgi:spermidine/putrescine transport system substrate-binding protein
MTFHPNEQPSAFSRRALLRRAGGAAAGLPLAGGLLAACANSTSVSTQAPPAGTGGGTTAASTVPTGPGGIPLARRDNPVKLPIYGDNAMVQSGMSPESGPLQVYNWSDYIDPATVKKFEKQFNTKVHITTFDAMDQAIAKLSATSTNFDVFFPTIDRIAPLVAAKKLAPINHDYIPNLAANTWPFFANPWYDQGAQYSVPYTVFTTGLGWRNDRVKDDIPSLGWNTFWTIGAKVRGKNSVLDDTRDTMFMAMSHANPAQANYNTEDPALINAALAALQQLNSTARPKVTVQQYETLAEGRVNLAGAWSGDMISNAIYYMPKGVPPTVLSYWTPPTGGPCSNDCIAVMAGGKNPVLAHAFLNFMLDPTNAYDNMANFNGYQPPINSLDPASLSSKLGLPQSIANAVVTQEQFASGVQAGPLSPTGQALWDSAWKTFNAG